MISLVEKQQIILRHYYNGDSQREIHRETGICRKTIRKYIRKYEAAKRDLMEGHSGVGSGNVIELIQDIVENTPI